MVKIPKPLFLKIINMFLKLYSKKKVVKQFNLAIMLDK